MIFASKHRTIKKSKEILEEKLTDYREYLIGSRLPRIQPKSFYRWADRNYLTNLICLNYLSNKGQTIDQFVFDLNQVHGENYFSEQDVVDFILKYQSRNPFKGK